MSLINNLSPDIQLVHSRIVKKKKLKHQMLKLKKNQRHTSIKELDDSINRMKRWIKELK